MVQASNQSSEHPQQDRNPRWPLIGVSTDDSFEYSNNDPSVAVRCCRTKCCLLLIYCSRAAAGSLALQSFHALFPGAKQLPPAAGTANLSLFIVPSKSPETTRKSVFQAGSEQLVVTDVIGFQLPGTSAS
jgi:hypothetical protein